MKITPDQVLEKLGLILPVPPTPAGVYKPFLIVGNQLYTSGHGPLLASGNMITGKAGADMNADEAKLAARQTGLAILATLKTNLGSLNKIRRVIKVLGMVNATPDFTEHPYVINGCSELFSNIWGPDHGVGVRSAIGVNSLPFNTTVEIEALFELY